MHGRDWRDSTDDQIDAALEKMESDDRHNISWMYDRRTPTLVPVALTTLAEVNFLPPA